MKLESFPIYSNTKSQNNFNQKVQCIVINCNEEYQFSQNKYLFNKFLSKKFQMDEEQIKIIKHLNLIIFAQISEFFFVMHHGIKRKMVTIQNNIFDASVQYIMQGK